MHLPLASDFIMTSSLLSCQACKRVTVHLLGSWLYTYEWPVHITVGSLPSLFQLYQRVAPHLWTPSVNALDELLKAIELQDGFQHLPLLWTDLLLFDYTRRTDLLEKLLGLMAKQKQEVS